MEILHISAECYPAAKAGGLGDVVGALPKYLNKIGTKAGVIIPKYGTKWINQQTFIPVFKGAIRIHKEHIPFTIEKEKTDQLGFPLFVANIPGKFDRPGVYADEAGRPYADELSRSLAFQQAVLQWVKAAPGKPKVLHCHDHHTALIPFMVKYCPEYQSLAHIPTAFTIHNGEYHGSFGWDSLYLLPFFEAGARVLLDWNNGINPLAVAIKCAWRITTVSPSYLEELKVNASGLESLIAHEQHKAYGILNGIDNQVWDPRTDPYIATKLGNDMEAFKNANKQVLGQHFKIDLSTPIITFIGRLVREKGADLIPDLVRRVLHSGIGVSFVILGTGEPYLHDIFRQLTHEFPGRFDAALEYNEQLAHQLYAGSDYLFMPSRVEPCGLNQMYAMRYGTLPIVRSVGGLKDTVPDIGEPGGQGCGIRFDHFTLEDSFLAIYRSNEFFRQKEDFQAVRVRISEVDFSWEQSAIAYNNIYQQMISIAHAVS